MMVGINGGKSGPGASSSLQVFPRFLGESGDPLILDRVSGERGDYLFMRQKASKHGAKHVTKHVLTEDGSQ
jgi:hypothetical protein